MNNNGNNQNHNVITVCNTLIAILDHNMQVKEDTEEQIQHERLVYDHNLGVISEACYALKETAVAATVEAENAGEDAQAHIEETLSASTAGDVGLTESMALKAGFYAGHMAKGAVLAFASKIAGAVHSTNNPLQAIALANARNKIAVNEAITVAKHIALIYSAAVNDVGPEAN